LSARRKLVSSAYALPKRSRLPLHGDDTTCRAGASGPKSPAQRWVPAPFRARQRTRFPPRRRGRARLRAPRASGRPVRPDYV